MRKIIVIIALVFSCIPVIRAQEVNNEWSNLGLKMGVGAYSFYGYELKNPRPMLGYVA